jgi:hypothetical protein
MIEPPIANQPADESVMYDPRLYFCNNLSLASWFYANGCAFLEKAADATFRFNFQNLRCCHAYLSHWRVELLLPMRTTIT